MKKGFKTVTLTLLSLLISSSIVQAKVISYEVKTSNGNIKSYDNDKLIESFLRFKVDEDGSEYYNDFIKNLTTGKYIAFRHHSKKYVKYDDIMNEFLEAQVERRKFDLEEYMLNAKGIELNNTMFEEKLEKEKAKQIADKVQKSLADINMPVMTKEDIKELNNIVTNNNYRDDIWKSLDNYYKKHRYIETGALSTIGYKNLDDDKFTQSVNTVTTRANMRKKVQNELSKNPKYANLFDLDNYLKFDNMTIDFSKLNKINHEDFPEREIVTDPSLDHFMKTLSVKNKDKGEVESPDDNNHWMAVGYPYYPIMQHTFMWKPYMERDFIETINRMRVEKGAKPLEYDVNLHAMARYSVKRSSMGFNHSCLSVIRPHLNNQLHYKHWLNGAIPYWRPYNLADYAPGWGIDLSDTSGVRGDSKGWVDQLEGNEKKIFNYDGKVRAMSDMDLYYENASDWLESIQMRYNKYFIDRAIPSFAEQYGKKMNFDRDLLDPSLTKIGVGVLCELPVCSADANGATGFFIITE